MTDRCGEKSEDRPVCLVESRSLDLALQHEDLVAEGEDLGVAGIAGREQSSESSEREARERGEQGHSWSAVPIQVEARQPSGSLGG